MDDPDAAARICIGRIRLRALRTSRSVVVRVHSGALGGNLSRLTQTVRQWAMPALPDLSQRVARQVLSPPRAVARLRSRCRTVAARLRLGPAYARPRQGAYSASRCQRSVCRRCRRLPAAGACSACRRLTSTASCTALRSTRHRRSTGRRLTSRTEGVPDDLRDESCGGGVPRAWRRIHEPEEGARCAAVRVVARDERSLRRFLAVVPGRGHASIAVGSRATRRPA